MINLISKEYYYSHIQEGSKYNCIYEDISSSKIGECLNIEVLYLLIDDKYFISYLEEWKYIMIPIIYDLDEVMTSIRNNNNKYNSKNWTLKKISDKRKHIINTFVFLYSRISISKNITPGETDYNGSWEISDSISGETIKFDLANKISYSFDNDNYYEYLIAHDDKAHYPVNPEHCIYIDKFIQTILNNGCKRD